MMTLFHWNLCTEVREAVEGRGLVCVWSREADPNAVEVLTFIINP